MLVPFIRRAFRVTDDGLSGGNGDEGDVDAVIQFEPQLLVSQGVLLLFSSFF